MLKHHDSAPSILGKSPARRLALLTLVLLAVPTLAFAQGYRIFGDSSDPTYYDTSWGFRTLPSVVELAHTDKFPVDATAPFLGSNALRLKWTSYATGDWALAVANPGWAPVSLDPYDSLIFWMRAPSAVPLTELPLIFLEDTSSRKTAKAALSTYVTSLPVGTWVRVVVPLQFFRDNPGTANLDAIKTLFFGKNPAGVSGTSRTLLLDEFRYAAADTVPPPPPSGLIAHGWGLHVDIAWDVPPDPDIESVWIDRREAGIWQHIGAASAEDGAFVDWRGAVGITGEYRVTATDFSFNTTIGDSVTATTSPMDDQDRLDMVQEASFRYFWNHAHPVSGLTREVLNGGDVCATGGTGFGIMAAIAAAERGFVARADVVDRLLTITGFLSTQVPPFHGAFPHWINGSTGAPVPFTGPTDDSRDLVETSYLMEGLLAARVYFDGADPDETLLRSRCTALWEGVEWDAFRPVGTNVLYWHLSPTTGFTNSIELRGWHEAMITYLLAIASPTHPVPASLYHDGWASGGGMVNGGTFLGYTLAVGPDWGGSLFFAHYSFLGFDPRGRRDVYADYFLHNRAHTLVNRAYCILNPGGYTGYGPNCWGLTASSNPWGYAAHAPYSNDNGTITPTAALSSMPYTPVESRLALQHFYEVYGDRLWTAFGFRDAFHPGLNWFSSTIIAIDQLPIVGMIENARSGLLWDSFMANAEIQPALTAIGFVSSTTAVEPEPLALQAPLRVSGANPSRAGLEAGFALDRAAHVELSVFDVQGRRVAVLLDEELGAGAHRARWDGGTSAGRSAAAGVYMVRLRAGERTESVRVVRLP